MYKIVRVNGDLRKILENRNSAKSRKLRMMNYPEPRPLKRMPMAHIVTVTGKVHLKTKMLMKMLSQSSFFSVKESWFH